MPVTVIVEDGTGKPDANSYASVVQADAYFASRPRSTSWTSLTEDGKGQHLIHATRILDHAIDWKGDPLSETQALAFPRLPEDLEAAEVPPVIITALYELAHALVVTDLTAAQTSSAFNKVKVGPIEIQTDSPQAPSLIPRFVRDLIAPYGAPRSGSGNVRLTRV